MKIAGLILICLVSVGCQLEGDYELDTHFPISVTFVNASDQTLNIDALGSCPEAEEYFLVTEKNLSENASFSIRADSAMAEEILARKFVVRGRCDGDQTTWEKFGSEIAEVVTQDVSNIKIDLNACARDTQRKS